MTVVDACTRQGTQRRFGRSSLCRGSSGPNQGVTGPEIWIREQNR